MAERERRLRFAEDDLDLPDFGDRAAVNRPPDLVGHARIGAGRDRHFQVIVTWNSQSVLDPGNSSGSPTEGSRRLTRSRLPLVAATTQVRD